MKEITSLHEKAKAVELSNNWPWAYALGYASGDGDRKNSRKHEHSAKDLDDYAKGYFKAYPLA